LLGTKYEILIEKPAKRGELLQGRTRDYRTILVPGDPSLIGSYMHVEITGTTGHTFTGAPIAARSALPIAG
jgi:TRAM domain